MYVDFLNQTGVNLFAKKNQETSSKNQEKSGKYQEYNKLNGRHPVQEVSLHRIKWRYVVLHSGQQFAP